MDKRFKQLFDQLAGKVSAPCPAALLLLCHQTWVGDKRVYCKFTLSFRCPSRVRYEPLSRSWTTL